MGILHLVEIRGLDPETGAVRVRCLPIRALYPSFHDYFPPIDALHVREESQGGLVRNHLAKIRVEIRSERRNLAAPHRIC
jgi:hypothetical protein